MNKATRYLRTLPYWSKEWEMRITFEQKLRAYEMREMGMTFTEIAEAMGGTNAASTVRKWVKEMGKRDDERFRY